MKEKVENEYLGNFLNNVLNGTIFQLGKAPFHQQ